MTSIYQALAQLEIEQKPGALCTIVHSQGSTPRHTGSKMLVYEDGSIIGSVGGGELENRVIQAALEAIQDGETRRLEYSMADPERGDPGVCGGSVEVFVEPVLPDPIVVVVGSGHVGKAVVKLAHWLGFRVAVSDDRPEFCTSDAVPDADEYYPVSMKELPDHLSIKSWSYLVLTTRGADVDIEGLPPLLKTQPGYIGVIGSRRRWEHTRSQLVEQGVGEELLEKVRSPIGLELNAETPEEIAVSILAEVIQQIRGGHGAPMSSLPEIQKKSRPPDTRDED